MADEQCLVTTVVCH